MAQQSHDVEKVEHELQEYVENQTLKKGGAAAGVGAVGGAAVGVIISAPVIIPALIGAGVMGAIGAGFAYLEADSMRKGALDFYLDYIEKKKREVALDRIEKNKREDALTERIHKKSASRKTRKRRQKKGKQLSNEMRPDSIIAVEMKEEKNNTKEVTEKQKKMDVIPKVVLSVTTTTTPTTMSYAQVYKLNSSSCTAKKVTKEEEKNKTKEVVAHNEPVSITSDKGHKISKALIVLISIEQYFGEKENSNKCIDLTSARMDTQHIIELYADKYEYNIITNKHKYCKLEELKTLLREAQGEFNKGDYQCIFVIFSGHGTKDKLMLSDYYDAVGDKDVGIYYKYNTMDRTELECYFNGDNVTNKADKLKVYIMDACRGSDDAVPIINDKDDKKYTGIEQRGNQQNIKNRKGLHANENRIIFYPNTEPYAAYGYKESGGILINGLYQTMIDDKNIDKNLDEIGDIIKDKAEADLVPVLGNNGKIIGEFTVKIEIKTTMKNRNMREIYFVKNEDKNKERIKTLNELNKDLNLLYV